MWEAIELKKLLKYILFQSMPNAIAYVELKDHFDEMVWLQWTGLTDRKGKEIYENDIFTAPHDCGPAGYQQQQGIVTFHAVRGYQWEYWKLDELEIIGNVFQNQELLK